MVAYYCHATVVSSIEGCLQITDYTRTVATILCSEFLDEHIARIEAVCHTHFA